MNKYIQTLKFEMKNIFRDNMTLLMLFYPVLILTMSIFFIPSLLNMTDNATPAAMYGSVISFIMLLSISSMIYGALLGFVLLDRKDEKTLFTIAATPLTVGGYLKFQAVYFCIIAFVTNTIILIGTKLFASDAYTFEVFGISYNLFANLTYPKILAFSASACLFVPLVGFLIAALGKNKIEGFAYMKSGGILLLLPVLTVLDTFSGGLQYLLGVTPNFWSIKGLLTTVMPSNDADINFWLYILIGSIYCIAINILVYRLFIKRSLRV